MPWDSTGQEEVFMWSAHYNYTAMQQLTLNAVLAYNSKIPHFAYNGNARRYFDFLVYGGENFGTERAIHHYGAPLNAIPLLEAFRANPDDIFLLHIGLGGVIGSLVNIAAGTGESSMGWHGALERLYPDSTSCDYGVGFYGHSINSGSYVVRTELGWSCFLCDLYDTGAALTIVPRDSFHTRLYLAPVGLDIVMEAGSFVNATLIADAQTLLLQLDTSQTSRVLPPRARIRLNTPALASGHRNATGFHANGLAFVRGAYEMPITPGKSSQVNIGWN